MTSLRRHIVLFVGIFFLISAFPYRVFSFGLIPVMNYVRADYSFGTQNWDMTEDLQGKVYIANYNGMLSFDGQRWQHYYLPNFTTVRSLLYDSDKGRIYAGGTEEFGYYSSEENFGVLTYHSLSDTLEEHNNQFSEVWNILKVGDNIIFRCDNCLFEYKNDNIEKLSIPGRISVSSLIGRKIYLGMEDGRIFSIMDGNLGTLTEEGKLSGKKIVAIMPYDDTSLLLCTPVAGLFLLKEGIVVPYETDYSHYLKSNQIFCGNSRNGVNVFGTVTGGALVIDNNTGEKHYINKESGLKNNTVLNTRFDHDGNLWFCLDNGVAYAAIYSPTRSLLGESNFIGAGYAAARYGNKLLLGTNQGLYIYEESKSGVPALNSVPLLQGQVWSITPAVNSLFVSTDRGLFIFNDSGLKKVDGVNGVYKTLLLSRHNDCAIASTYDSFHFLQKSGNSWIDKGKIDGGNNLTGDFHIDEDNRIWTSHWKKGIYFLPFNISDERFTSCQIFDHNSGLPADDNNTLAFYEGSPVSSTYSGFYNLNPSNLKAYENKDLSQLLNNGRKGHLKALNDGSLVMIDEQGLIIFKRSHSGNFEKKEISGPGLFKEIIPGFADVSKYTLDALLVSSQNGFTIVDIKRINAGNHTWNPFVSNIYANSDSLIYQSPLVPDNSAQFQVSPDLNTLRFELAYPECNFGHATEFSTFLENYDKGWSPFTTENTKEYTKLPDGKYVLRLRAKDNFSGEILESSFGFTVTPPWFRTIWAKGVYTIISFLVLFLLFVAVRGKMSHLRQKLEKRKEKELEDLRKENEREAMQKDMEIAGLKNEQLEQEVKYKSDELSATTMSLISKNETLRDIGEQISRINKMAPEVSISTLQKNLSKLQKSIEDSIGKNTDWKTFNKNFDLVYGDYMKRLLILHPDLSQSEKRLCCYIRMGLASKEIAPLINISYRSVEMARYRLRKKINLAQEDSLADYLMSV